MNLTFSLSEVWNTGMKYAVYTSNLKLLLQLICLIMLVN